MPEEGVAVRLSVLDNGAFVGRMTESAGSVTGFGDATARAGEKAAVASRGVGGFERNAAKMRATTALGTNSLGMFNTGLGKVGTGLAASGRSFASHSEKVSAAGRGIKGAGSSLSYLSVPLLAAGYQAIKMSDQFQSAMLMVQNQAGASGAEVRHMSAALLDMAPKVGVMPVALAQSLYHIESLNVRGAQALKELHSSVMLAKVGNSSLETTTNAVAGAMHTGAKDIRSAGEAAAVMSAIVGHGNMRMQDLVDTFHTGILPTAKGVGIGFRDIGAAIASTTSNTVPASVAANRLRLSLIQMAAPGGKATKELQTLGLTNTSLANDLHKPGGLITALGDLRGHLDKLPGGIKGVAAMQAVSNIFGGSRGVAGALPLLQHFGEIKDIRGQLQGANTGTLDAAFKRVEDTPQAKMERAKAAGGAALTRLGDVIKAPVADVITKVASVVMTLANAFQKLSPPVQHAILIGGLLIAVLGPILVIIGSVIGAVGVIGGVFAALSAPVLIVIGVIALVVAGFILFRKQIMTAVGAVVGFIGNAVHFIGRSLHITGSDISALGHAFTTIFAAIKRVVLTFVDVWKWGFEHVTLPIIEHVWPAIQSIIGNTLKVIGGLVKIFAGVFSGDWTKVWDGVKQVFSGAIGALVGFLVDLPMKILGALAGLAAALLKGLVTPFQDAVNSVTGLIGGIPNAIQGAVSGSSAAVTTTPLTAAVTAAAQHTPTPAPVPSAPTAPGSAVGALPGFGGASIGRDIHIHSHLNGREVAHEVIRNFDTQLARR